MGFAVPTQTDSEGREYFKLRNHEGRLVTIKVAHLDESYVNEKFKKDGPKPTVWGDVTIIDGPNAGKVFRRAEFGGQYVYDYVAAAQEASPSDLVLARITRGDQGGRPFFLNHPDTDDIDLATEFYSSGGGDAAEEDPRDESTDDDTPPWAQ